MSTRIIPIRLHHIVSRTKANVPKHEEMESSKRPLSCFCTNNKVSMSPRSSVLWMSISPCTRRNKLRYVWTASKSRRDLRRCVRAFRKMLKSCTVTKERISRSTAAGESDFAKAKNNSSVRRVSLRSSWVGTRRDAYNCPPLVPAIVFLKRRFWQLRRFSPISASTSFPVLFLEPGTAFQHLEVWVGKRVPSPGLLEALLACFGADIQNKLTRKTRKTSNTYLDHVEIQECLPP